MDYLAPSSNWFLGEIYEKNKVNNFFLKRSNYNLVEYLAMLCFFYKFSFQSYLT